MSENSEIHLTEYKCNKCNKLYSSHSSLCNHNKKFHKDTVVKNVVVCGGKRGTIGGSIVVLCDSNKNEQKYLCKYCNKNFNDRSNKHKHEKICKNKTTVLEENKILKEENIKIKKENNILKINQIVPLNTTNINNGIINKNNGTINNTITNDILSNVKDISKELLSIKIVQTELVNIKETINKLNTEISSNILLKINEIKKNYTEDIRSIINLNEKSNRLDILDIIAKQNELLLSKTQNFINDILPKNQTQYYNQIENIIKSFREETTKNLEEIKNNKSDLNLEKISNVFEQKQNQFITGIQQPLLNYITSSEDRITNNIKVLSENTILNERK